MSVNPFVHVTQVNESHSYVWDTVTLAWVVAVQVGIGGGDASALNQLVEISYLTSLDAKVPALVGGRIPVVLPAGGGGLTDTELRATPVPVSGTVTATGTFWQVTQPVSGTFWQVTQPVSIASMPSTPVTGTFWQSTQPISAASLPLPTGAALEAGNLATMVTSLATLHTDLIASEPRKAQGAVAADDPAYVAGTTSDLSLTTAGRLRIDTEAGVRDFDGVSALYTADRVMRRFAEQAQLNDYIQSMQSIIASEWESSQRMGFEIR